LFLLGENDGGLGEEVHYGQTGDLTDTLSGILEKDHQHSVPTRFRGLTRDAAKLSRVSGSLMAPLVSRLAPNNSCLTLCEIISH
jgi:hypothetical protein